MRSTLTIPPTRDNLAALSGEHVALFDCLECPDGVYLPAPEVLCTSCGAAAPDAVAGLMAELAAKRKAA